VNRNIEKLKRSDLVRP